MTSEFGGGELGVLDCYIDVLGIFRVDPQHNINQTLSWLVHAEILKLKFVHVFVVEVVGLLFIWIELIVTSYESFRKEK